MVVLNFPDRANKVWHSIEEGHGGKVNDSRFGTRMRGEGEQAAIINQQFKKFRQLYGMDGERWSLDTSQFSRPGQQMKLLKAAFLYLTPTMEQIIERIDQLWQLFSGNQQQPSPNYHNRAATGCISG